MNLFFLIYLNIYINYFCNEIFCIELKQFWYYNIYNLRRYYLLIQIFMLILNIFFYCVFYCMCVCVYIIWYNWVMILYAKINERKRKIFFCLRFCFFLFVELFSINNTYCILIKKSLICENFLNIIYLKY